MDALQRRHRDPNRFGGEHFRGFHEASRTA
jgi:hypothetical protein